MVVTLVDDPQTVVRCLESVRLGAGRIELENRIGNFVRHEESRLLAQ
jgi:hypothetical protein